MAILVSIRSPSCGCISHLSCGGVSIIRKQGVLGLQIAVNQQSANRSPNGAPSGSVGLAVVAQFQYAARNFGCFNTSIDVVSVELVLDPTGKFY